jgi:hypothetical protein
VGLSCLVEQIEWGNGRDDHGHPLRNLKNGSQRSLTVGALRQRMSGCPGADPEATLGSRVIYALEVPTPDGLVEPRSWTPKACRPPA